LINTTQANPQLRIGAGSKRC